MGWIGVDLDGTLAHYESGQFPEIGKPIQPMLDRVRGWLDDGQEVRICTARAAHGEEEIARVRQWLEPLGLGHLQITCQKDPDMDELWDDKAVQVKPNTGEPIVDQSLQESWAREVSIKDRPQRFSSWGTSADEGESFGLVSTLDTDLDE